MSITNQSNLKGVVLFGLLELGDLDIEICLKFEFCHLGFQISFSRRHKDKFKSESCKLLLGHNTRATLKKYHGSLFKAIKLLGHANNEHLTKLEIFRQIDYSHGVSYH